MVAFDTTWGNSLTVERDYSAQSAVPRQDVFELSDMINVPGRGQPRVFMAAWTYNVEITEDLIQPVTLDFLWIDWFVGVGMTNMTMRTSVYAPRLTDPPVKIEIPAETLRARFAGIVTVSENPAAERRIMKISTTLICGPYFPFANDERQSYRGAY